MKFCKELHYVSVMTAYPQNIAAKLDRMIHSFYGLDKALVEVVFAGSIWEDSRE